MSNFHGLFGAKRNKGRFPRSCDAHDWNDDIRGTIARQLKVNGTTFILTTTYLEWARLRPYSKAGVDFLP
jgi:hypothetical protein